MKTAEDRFWSKVDKTEGCWQWTGAVAANGYGRFWTGRPGTTTVAHRLAYEMQLGTIPPGLVIDHLCRNRACVNPQHLEAVTQRENLLRGETSVAREVAQTHCLRGHELVPENLTNLRPGKRECRECGRLRAAENRRRGAA